MESEDRNALLSSDASVGRDDSVAPIVCYERWDWDKFEELRRLPMSNVATAGVMKNIDFKPLVQGRTRVHYTTKKGFHGGRVYGVIVKWDPVAKAWKDSGAALQRLPVWIRHYLAHEYYRDFDIVNCAPTLLMQILQKYNLCPPELSEYWLNRETLFMRYTGIMSRDDIKTAFLKVFHNGAGDSRIPETQTLRNAIVRSIRALAKLPDYQALYEACVNAQNNQIGTFTAKVWQREESCVLMQVRQYFIEMGYSGERMVLCFDGLMLEKDESITTPIDLQALEAYVMQNTGYQVKIEEKSLVPTEKDAEAYEACRQRLRSSNSSSSSGGDAMDVQQQQ